MVAEQPSLPEALPSFPTRRSSDLGADAFESGLLTQDGHKADGDGFFDWVLNFSQNQPRLDGTDTFLFTRSEEHTSELQSQSNLVCRLLLEKKTLQTQNNDFADWQP